MSYPRGRKEKWSGPRAADGALPRWRFVLAAGAARLAEEENGGPGRHPNLGAPVLLFLLLGGASVIG
jgi:hypothetical protein